MGPSSASLKTPPKPTLTKPEPEYRPLLYMKAEMKDENGKDWTSVMGLLDSGSQGSCVNQRLSHKVLTNPELKSNPVTMIMADGNRSPSAITHYHLATIRIAGHEELIALDSAPLSHDLIFGMPWHRKHNPYIDYQDETLTFRSEFCRQHCAHYGKTILLYSRDDRPEPEQIPTPEPEQIPTPEPEQIPTPEPEQNQIPEPEQIELIQPPKRNPRKNRKRRPKSTAKPQPESPTSNPPNNDPGACTKTSQRRHLQSQQNPTQDAEICAADPPLSDLEMKEKGVPKVALIGAAAFAYVCNQPGTELFFLSMRELQEAQLSSQETEEEPPTPEFNLATIPAEYHEFADLFDKEESDKLPPHRSYDHTIPLEPGTTPPWGPIYKNSPIELEAVRKYVDENLRKGFIKHSQSPCGAPIVFARKADGTLRLCVDYRGLNKITVKNRYPLPLIGELLERMSKAKYFTKFDVRDGYNRLRMAPGKNGKQRFDVGMVCLSTL
jgi:hypothetical protein